MQSALTKRSLNQCEICQSSEPSIAFLVPESPDKSINSHIYICHQCATFMDFAPESRASIVQHFRCLVNSMWSTTPAVQVMSYRLLNKCLPEPWAQDAIEMMYLEDELLSWAQNGLLNEKQATLDVNGVALNAGDAVTIVKDLDVKGTSFKAKRGTPVRNIGLCDNPLHIEGKVNGQRIVIIAAYTKRN
jgi:protein PhnA